PFYSRPVPPRLCIRVGPTVRVSSVHRCAAFLQSAGPPTPLYSRGAHRPSQFGTPLRGLFTVGRSPHAFVFAWGPPSESVRYTAARPFYSRPVPPRLCIRVGPTARVNSVHRCAAFLQSAGSPHAGDCAAI